MSNKMFPNRLFDFAEWSDLMLRTMKRITAKQATRIIKAAGGDVAFMRWLGIKVTHGSQRRVNNWKRRGVSKNAIVEHYDKLKELHSRVIAPKSQPNAVAAASSITATD
jgi:hypothetical protein